MTPGVTSRRWLQAAAASALFVLLTNSYACAPAEAPQSAAPSTGNLEERLKADIGFLSADALEGRGTPSRGLEVAALYLESELRGMGVPPAQVDSYQQRYALGEYNPPEAKVTVKLNGQTLNASDYVLWNVGYDPEKGPLKLPLVFAGNGIVSEDKNVDELSALDLDLKGKAAVVNKGATWPLVPTEVFGPDRAMGKLIGATVRGANMLVYLSNELDEGDEAEAHFLHEMKHAGVCFVRDPKVAHASALNPVLVLKPAAFAKATGKGIDTLKPGPLGNEIEVNIVAQVRAGTAANIAGKIEGTDPKLKEEWIVLVAHYDHIGMHEVPAGQDGIWNGADDNASGTAAVLELARRFSRNPGKRSVLILFTSGEDRGILGSAYYAAAPLVPMDKVVLLLNPDMIGRSPDKVQVVTDASPALYDEAVKTAKSHGIEAIPDQQPTWRLVYLTDAYHFARAGIPYAFFFTGTHPDYHQPSDTADKIHYKQLASIVEMTADMARTYADGAAPAAFTKPKWFVTP
jgi:hypothetical protein